MENDVLKQGALEKNNWEHNVLPVVFVSLVVGALSGLVVELLLNGYSILKDGRPADNFWYFQKFIRDMGAGIFFGIITLFWFLFLFRKEMSQMKQVIVSFLWCFFSFLSYYVAVLIANAFERRGEGDASLFGAGFIGAAIVAAAFHFLFRKMGLVLYLFVCFTGLFLVFTMLVFHSLYIPWQGGIAMLLGYAAVRKTSQKI